MCRLWRVQHYCGGVVRHNDLAYAKLVVVLMLTIQDSRSAAMGEYRQAVVVMKMINVGVTYIIWINDWVLIVSYCSDIEICLICVVVCLWLNKGQICCNGRSIASLYHLGFRSSKVLEREAKLLCCPISLLLWPHINWLYCIYTHVKM